MPCMLRVLFTASVIAASLTAPTGAFASTGGAEAEQALAVVTSYVERHAADSFAGAYFDADGVLHAGFTSYNQRRGRYDD